MLDYLTGDLVLRRRKGDTSTRDTLAGSIAVLSRSCPGALSKLAIVGLPRELVSATHATLEPSILTSDLNKDLDWSRITDELIKGLFVIFQPLNRMRQEPR